ncbi:MAG: diaminopimelate epimerase [Lachnospiraceae bacterium]|nr:diaminopimelate epimerase [Lachnospiraceae bacterium]
MRFTKMQAYGNDYVYVDAIHQKIEHPNELAIKMSDRHFGIGADGLVLICPSECCDFRMRIFNPDGTEAEMCGNAVRSTGKFVYYHGLTTKKVVTIETLGGNKIITLEVKDGRVINIEAAIGEPIFEPAKIPVETDQEEFILQPLRAADQVFQASSLSWGNPHTLIQVEDLDTLDIEKYGPLIENHEVFTKRTNVTFVQLVDRQHLKIREWERGTGETIGCGTGCCTAVVFMHRLGLCDRIVDVQQIGGTLHVEWDDRNIVHMKGPSYVVYEGEYKDESAALMDEAEK